MTQLFFQYSVLFTITMTCIVYLIGRWMKYKYMGEWKEMEYKAQHAAGRAAVQVAELQLQKAETMLKLGEQVGEMGPHYTSPFTDDTGDEEEEEVEKYNEEVSGSWEVKEEAEDGAGEKILPCGHTEREHRERGRKGMWLPTMHVTGNHEHDTREIEQMMQNIKHAMRGDYDLMQEFTGQKKKEE